MTPTPTARDEITAPVIASVSGGKDSAALCLHLRELGVPYRAVHFEDDRSGCMRWGLCDA